MNDSLIPDGTVVELTLERRWNWLY